MRTITALATTMALTSMTAAASAPLNYPAAPSDGTVDEYFGKKVADPYRPLENDTASATLEWVKAENALTQGYLSKIPYREELRRALTKLTDYRKTGTPSRENDGKLYFYSNNGLQNQSALFRKATLDGDPELFLDPNTLSEDGTVALTGVVMSPDGKYTAYTISRSGSDWTEIYVMDTETKELLADHIEWAKFTTPAWYGDGFFYSAYDKPEDGKEFSNSNENHRIYFHKLGTPQSQDTVAFSDPDHPLHFHGAYIPEGTEILVLVTSGQGAGNALAVKDLSKPDSEWITVVADQNNDVAVLDATEGKLLVSTNFGAPKGRIVEVDMGSPQPENWLTIIPEQEGVLTSTSLLGPDKMIVGYEKDASDHLYIYSRDGKLLRQIQLPGIGSAGVSSDKKSNEAFIGFSSFTVPGDSYAYDFDTDSLTLVNRNSPEGFNPDDYVTEQVFFPSKDGTKIPMFLTYKKGLKKDGNNPVYLYGYGGFNISLTPGFSPYRLLWLENGGIYAQTNLRGGSEYGEEWHQAGTKMNKQNVFDDFIAAGDYMVREGWTKPELLVGEGGSNGGLLIGATVNQRPDLFRVAIPRVGVMDMMRYHLFTIGWNWASDYGTSADSPEMAEYLLGYSPIHNIRTDGTPYPAILVTTADHDDRVVPAHSFKYAATLQAADTGDNPKLIRIDSKAGHGAGKPVSKVIDEWTDIYSFIFNNLNITPKY